MRTLPDTYATTRESLHRLAVYVISPARASFNPRQVALSTFGKSMFHPGQRDHFLSAAGA